MENVKTDEQPKSEMNLEDVLHTATAQDLKILHTLAKISGMKPALSEFAERDNTLRLSRIVFVNWDFDKHNTQWEVCVD